jgi:hypothetical protein
MGALTFLRQHLSDAVRRRPATQQTPQLTGERTSQHALITYCQLLCHFLLLTFLQEDLERVAVAGKGRVDITVGSALDIFGGKLPYADVVAWHKKQQAVAV